MNKVCYTSFKVRIQILISLLFVSVGTYGLGYTPTDGGLVVNLKPGQTILLSTWVDVNGDGDEDDGEEFFVCHYPSKTGGHFGYTNWDGGKGNFLKLFPQKAGATEPATPSIWSIDTALTRIEGSNNFALGGISYTMWSSNPESEGGSYTLLTSSGNNWKYQGDLTREKNNNNACDVIFVAPTKRSSVTSFDPKKTLGRDDADDQGRIDGKKGFGFLGLPYREVYMMVIPRTNKPNVYGNAALVGFNTTKSNYSYRNGEAKPGQALFAYNDRPGEGENYVKTKRTIFRLYILDDPLVSSCPVSYYFAYDEQDFKGYRMGPGNDKDNKGKTWTDSTDAKKIYTIDRLVCMERIPDTKYYISDYMYVPIPDSTYYYVGYKNKYCHSPATSGTDAFDSQFKNIDTLKLQHMDKPAPRGAFGRMIVDTTQTSKQNLGVEFRPAGVFLRVDAGGGRYRNIEMHPEPGDTSWICNEMWTITGEYLALRIKATLYSGAEFSDEDPGSDIPGWSEYVVGNTVPLADDPSNYVTGNMTGWARVYTNKSTTNGGLEFVRAEKDKYVRYDNNGHFGATLPNTHAKAGETRVVLSEPRLLEGYNFRGWYTKKDTTAEGGMWHHPGDTVDLNTFDGDSLILYAQAKYTGSISVAISFMKDDGKRYFLTHPSGAPRFARARYIEDWTDTYQGMANEANEDPRYLSTYLIIGNNTVCKECKDGEYVLDPRREMVHGAVDSVMFYEKYAPAEDVYIGLYYDTPNTILANNTWAGLFKSTKGWPDPASPCIDSTKLFSTHYLHTVAGDTVRTERTLVEGNTIVYNATDNQFDGTTGSGTNFTISGVGVVDEHYVVLPDKTVEWTDTITFGIHKDERIENPVWSKLIGKQLMLQMMVGDKITYFHPNDDKIITEYTQMRLNSNYRLDETFEYIRDARVESLGEAVLDVDKPHMNDRLEKNYFGRLVTSGLNSPIDVIYNGKYIDIIDTIRITLRPLGPNKIKEYYGRWKEGAPGLHIRPDGSRYRDILVITKTYHHGPEKDTLILTPVQPSYTWPPMDNVSHTIDFKLTKQRVRPLHDTEEHVLDEEILDTSDETASLRIGPGHCSFTQGGIYFKVDTSKTLKNYVTVVTKTENLTEPDHDTLVVTTTPTVDGKDYTVTARVPLMQTAMELEEVVWSVVGNGNRYFIMAGSGGLIYRQFIKKGNTLYKKEDGNTSLKQGSANPENSDTRYITPWDFKVPVRGVQQVMFRTEFGVDKNFSIDGSSRPGLSDGTDEDKYAGAALLTYEYVTENFNDNGNFEEVVKIKYGANQWLQFIATEDTTYLTLTSTEEDASIFSWTYLMPEYYLLNNGAYPSRERMEFGYNKLTVSATQTLYKAYRNWSMLLNNTTTYCNRWEDTKIDSLISPTEVWKTNYSITHIRDSRFPTDSSHLSISTNSKTLVTTVTPSGDSPLGTRYPADGGPFVNIVDTLDVRISLQDKAPDYRFADKWSSFKSVEDAHLKIPLVRRTYHEEAYDSLLCTVDRDEYIYVFPSEITESNNTHTFTFGTAHRRGTHVLDVEGDEVAFTNSHEDFHTSEMRFRNHALTEIRLLDAFGNTPDWCEISDTTDNTITVRCKDNGIRSPRSANIYLAYTIQVEGVWRYVNFSVQVMQASRFQYTGHRHLLHSQGASGAPLKDGVQQVHENRTIVYYYNPSNAAQSTDQYVELPLRERNFYGWWRWYSLQPGEEDTDIPTEKWREPPMNSAGSWTIPYRTIGDSVYTIDELTGDTTDRRLVTQGRYTVFHVPSQDYNARKNPPANAPRVYPPRNKDTVTYAVDLSVYYDNLPLSMSEENNVDIAKLDTIEQIIEPTLSLREIFELHPWTEMAERMENYKDTIDGGRNFKYLEDHKVMAPTDVPLLLTTEQRYDYDHIKNTKHSESLMGYYMRDDNWATWAGNQVRQDSMIWCGGWDVPCGWYTFNQKDSTYTKCNYTVTASNDFLQVPKKFAIPSTQEFDTVIYCLRSRSWKTLPDKAGKDSTVEGAYWFNICRYTIIYHRPNRYGPKLEEGGKALITNDEIEQNFEVLERLNFDYDRPGSDYAVYPHPLPWGDVSYGFAYPRTNALPDNRPHNKGGLTNLANMGEYNLINRIPSFGTYWHKMEQHGGASKGYMIYCDGMSSAGQVAALHLDTTLCKGQKMYFSGYVANPGNESGKACPNFLFAVQGSKDDVVWEDITSYMTGDIPQSNKWYQIYFPIEQSEEYSNFRVRVHNMASNDDGNDFLIDDMCIFATKPPLMVYQANTTCKSGNENDSLTHVVLRVDYQGFDEKVNELGYQYYTIQQITKDNDSTFVALEDGYYNPETHGDTICGKIYLPKRDFVPSAGTDSIFPNLKDLITRFETTFEAHEAYEKDPSKPNVPVFREGYVYEHLDDSIRPVLYIVHTAKMSSRNSYIARMAGAYTELLNSDCALTRPLRVRNRMFLTLNGEEQPDKEVENMCANTLYDVSLMVKGTLLLDSVAPVEIIGSCYNDWLLYGDTSNVTSVARYGYKYSDIAKVISILRADETHENKNLNQFAHSLADVKKSVMHDVQQELGIGITGGVHPYDILKHLVDSGFLTLYKSSMTIITPSDSAIHYTIFPIPGSGSQVLEDLNIDVCPTPVQIKLESSIGKGAPLIIGGLNRDSTELALPIDVLADVQHANTSFAIPIDSLMMNPIATTEPNVALKQITLISTNDSNYHEGVHTLALEPDRTWKLNETNVGYYTNGNDTLVVVPTAATNYTMREGYYYTFGIEMMTASGATGWDGGVGECPVGTVPFTLHVVPSYLRWDPQTEDNRWNNPDNWIGITQTNEPIHSGARYAPLQSTYVVIPPMTDGKPYPVLPATITAEDSVQKVGFQYNVCHSIRFLPGGALNQQQRLEYDSVIADLSGPHDTWAFRSSPVEGLLSGDLFMSNADLTYATPTWEVGEFDAAGRNYTTGNASFWLSLFSRDAIHMNNPYQEDVQKIDTIETEAADWSRVTNALTLPLPPAQGWAMYSHTHSGREAAIRLPKHDDIYYYYTRSGDKVLDLYEPDLRAKRAEMAGGADKVGKLAFYPGKAVTSKEYRLSNGTAATSFVFGNPTMGYIDIWGFIEDNSENLDEEIGYMDAGGTYREHTEKSAALSTENKITSLPRYLPPMHAIVLKLKEGKAAATTLDVILNTSRIVTDVVVTPPTPAPKRTHAGAIINKGIMTVTAVNPVDEICTSRLLLGQGFNDEIISGEDAILTTINVDNFTGTSAPATPFNIYAMEGKNGLCIDLREQIINVPIAFYNTDLPYEPVSYLWFTGVNNIDGELVLYDALTGTERPIMDGICLSIETPEVNHETRYFIRRAGFDPAHPDDDQPITTGVEPVTGNSSPVTYKLIKDGHVLIIRDGHVYSVFGQKIR